MAKWREQRGRESLFSLPEKWCWEPLRNVTGVR